RSAFPRQRYVEWVCVLLWLLALPRGQVPPGSALCRRSTASWSEREREPGLLRLQLAGPARLRLFLASFLLQKWKSGKPADNEVCDFPEWVYRFRRLGAQHHQTSSSLRLGNYIAVVVRRRALIR